jgi:hypothetical protein
MHCCMLNLLQIDLFWIWVGFGNLVWMQKILVFKKKYTCLHISFYLFDFYLFAIYVYCFVRFYVFILLLFIYFIVFLFKWFLNGLPASTSISMPVPSSYNDITESSNIKKHIGWRFVLFCFLSSNLVCLIYFILFILICFVLLLKVRK